MRNLFIKLLILSTIISSVSADNDLLNDICPGEEIAEMSYITDIGNVTSHNELGDIASGTDDYDYYYFTPAFSGEVAISFTSSDDIDLDISIIDCDAQEIESFSRKDSGDVQFDIQATDTVYIKIISRTASLTTYDLELNFDPDAKTYTCAAPKDFSVRKSLVLPGNITAIGHSNLCSTSDGTTCDTTQTVSNHSSNMIYINATSSNEINASDPSENTTTATLDIPSDATVIWAGLYWQAMIYDIKQDDDYILSQRGSSVKFKTPTTGEYVDLIADEHHTLFLKRGSRYEEHYQSFKDVTSLVTEKGEFSVANIQATQGNLAAPGAEAVWTLQVIYEKANAKPRSIAINDGFVALFNETLYNTGSDDGSDTYATEVNTLNGNTLCQTGDIATGVHDANVTVDVGGFLTPKAPGFTTDLSIFISDGDTNPGSALEKLFVTKKDGSISLVDGGYSSGAWTYEVLDINGNPQAGKIPDFDNPVGVTIKNYSKTDLLDTEQSQTEITFAIGYDRLFLGVIGFATDLREPTLCYDYSYEQNRISFTEENNGTQNPRIVGDVFEGEPIDVSIYIKNLEDSDVKAEDIIMNVLNFDTSQATYIRNTTAITEANSVFPNPVPDVNVSDAHIAGVEAGSLNSLEYFYTYFQLDPSQNEIDMALNARIDYNVTLPTDSGPLTIPYRVYLNNEVELCTSGYSSFTPEFGIFNVSQKYNYDNGGYYNIPTQVAKKVDDFLINSYDTASVHTEKGVNTVVAVELIGIDGYQSSDVACDDPASSISPRVWITFDNNSSSELFNKLKISQAIANGSISDRIGNHPNPIATAEEFFAIAQKSAAFRLSYNIADNNGSLIKLENAYNRQGDFVGYNVLNFTELIRVNDGKCLVDVDGNVNNQDTIPRFCNNAGGAAASSMTAAELAVCMECVYGYDVKYDCSRDNFAIRPEAFKVEIFDNNESDIATDPVISVDTVAGVSTGHIAAGYDYRYDVTAVSHADEEAVIGYSVNYEQNATTLLPHPDHNITYYWIDDPAHQPGACDDSDKYPTIRMNNGAAINAQNKADNVGRYTLQMRDTDWTAVDQYSAHHTGSYYRSDSDCKIDSDIVPNNQTEITRDNMGCNISSAHTKEYILIETDLTSLTESITPAVTTTYQDYDITVKPYHFNVAALQFNKGAIGSNTAIGPNNAYIYANNLLNTNDDLNMSVRYTGTIRAEGKDGTLLSNFVTGCNADNLVLDINTSDLPAAAALPSYVPNFSYRLRDKNSSGEVINDNIQGNNGNSLNLLSLITLGENSFFQDMNGEANIELNLNFDRLTTNPINPIRITFNDFNTTCATAGECSRTADMETANAHGDIAHNQELIFVYGREHVPRHRVAGNTANVNFSYEFYCDNSGLTLPNNCNIIDYTTRPSLTNPLSANAQLSPDGVRWYVQTEHNTNVDGNVTFTRTRTNNDYARFANGTNITLNANATGATYIYDGNDNYPFKTTIQMNTPDWLIYNRFDTSATINNGGNVVNNFELEFTQSGGWTGEDASGMQVDTNASSVTNRRIQW